MNKKAIIINVIIPLSLPPEEPVPVEKRPKPGVEGAYRVGTESPKPPVCENVEPPVVTWEAVSDSRTWYTWVYIVLKMQIQLSIDSML